MAKNPERSSALWVYRGFIIVGILLLIAAGWAAVNAPLTSVAAPTGPVLVGQDFRGSSAPGFQRWGSACLTGASEKSDAPGSELDGCPPAAVGPVPPNGDSSQGFLRLNDAAGGAGGVIYDQAILGTSGVEASFEQYQYGGSGQGGEGLSFFLTDGSATTSAVGAPGGSLGYAQGSAGSGEATIPGIPHSYLGFGFDALGNYFFDRDGRGNGCIVGSPAGAGTGSGVPNGTAEPTDTPGAAATASAASGTATPETTAVPGGNMVTVRGPGNGVDGYCFLAATSKSLTHEGPWTSTLPGSLRGALSSLPAGSTAAAAALEPVKRIVTVRISPGPNPEVTVWVDFTDGAGPQQVLKFAAPQPMPSTYKFGFAATGGSSADVHLIRSLRVQAIAPLPALKLVKQIASDPPLPLKLVAGDVIHYEYAVTNIGGAPISGIRVNDPLISQVSCPRTALTLSEGMVCKGDYSVTAEDVSRGYITGTAVASGNGPDGTVQSPVSSATVPLGSLSLALATSVDNGSAHKVGQIVRYQYVAINTGAAPITGLVIQDNRIQGIRCDSTTLTAAGEPGSRTVCYGDYRVSEADIDPGGGHTITNTAIAKAISGPTLVASPPEESTIRVQANETATATPTSTSPALAAAGRNVAVSLALAVAGVVFLVAGILLAWRNRRRLRRSTADKITGASA